MSDDIFGQSNYGGNYVKKNYYKLKDGELAFRILPALGDNALDGRWSNFWKVHYGYKNSKGQLRTFESPLVKNNKTKMIEVPDAALERIETMKAAFEKAKKEGNKEMIAQLDKYVGQKGMYNLDANHYMNVIDQAGNIGILKIRHRCKIALDDEIKRLRGEGVDPLSPTNGRFFVFRRSGMGLDTTFKVTTLQETVDVPGFGPMKRDVVHALTPEIGKRCATRLPNGKFKYVEAANLVTLYKKPTSEEVAAIVKSSDIKTGNSLAVDMILDAKEGASETVAAEESYDDSNDYVDTSAQATKVVAPVTTAAPVLTATPVQVAVTAPAAAPLIFAQTPAPVPVAAPVVAAVSDQSDEDFLKSLGL